MFSEFQAQEWILNLLGNLKVGTLLILLTRLITSKKKKKKQTKHILVFHPGVKPTTQE